MTTATTPPAQAAEDHGSRLTKTYTLVIVVEVVTLAALWWLQQAFTL